MTSILCSGPRFSTKISIPLNHTTSIFDTLIPSSLTIPPNPLFVKPISIQRPSSLTIPPNPLFVKPISIQRLPTKLCYSSTSLSPSSSLQPIEELPPKLQEIIKLFQSVPDSKAKYEQLLFYGKNLTPLDTHYKTTENKVQGCVSQVWVRAYLDSDKKVVFQADSDSLLTKGLAALLVKGLSGRSAEEILRVSPDFAVLLGLQQSLTPSRNNGFLNMLKMMQNKAVQLLIEAEKGSDVAAGETSVWPNGEKLVEVDGLSWSLVYAVPKKRTSKTKSRIRKNVWKKKAYKAALKAFSLAKSLSTGNSKSFFVPTNK